MSSVSLVVALPKLQRRCQNVTRIPDRYPRDAARNADQDTAEHVSRFAAQKDNGQDNMNNQSKLHIK